MELKITTEKILAGAAKCPDAKAVLKEMFPEAFSGVRFGPYDPKAATDKSILKNCIRDMDGTLIVEPRSEASSYPGSKGGLFVRTPYVAEIVKDGFGMNVILITKK